MKKDKDLIPVRLSHLLRHCSVGAIVRGPKYLMTVKDIREWTGANGEPAGREILYVDGVRAALGIEEKLYEPPVATELENGLVDGFCIPALRFPSWMRCPNPQCGLLYYRPWRSQERSSPRCKKCNKLLEEVPWILVHPDGHMTDVPWHWLAHEKTRKLQQQQCKADHKEHYLSLVGLGESKRKLRCSRCGATSDFYNGIQIPYGNSRRQPWLNEPPENTSGNSGNKPELASVLEINDVRVHSASTRSALVIPPESRIRKGTVVDRLYRSSQKLKRLEWSRTPLARKSALQTLVTEFRCTINDIENAWEEILKGYPRYKQNITPGMLLEDEYQALLEEIPDMSEDEDFVTRHLTPMWKAMLTALPAGEKPRKIVDIVSRLISVERLKEIQVLTGFQRLGGTLTPPDIVNRKIWLPAIELYGEGIFFTLEEKFLTVWESCSPLQSLAGEFEERYKHADFSFNPDPYVSPRFLLLHTMAHLLIRQLEMEAGYPAASLKERIYCTSDKAKPMSGILVYVAVPDVVGSLGGLAELAEPRRFLKLLSSVFDHAEWCSLDPVCREHTGQGPYLLNRAACHACALIPEPGCAFGNVLLDRTFIRGDIAAGIPALLDLL